MRAAAEALHPLSTDDGFYVNGVTDFDARDPVRDGIRPGEVRQARARSSAPTTRTTSSTSTRTSHPEAPERVSTDARSEAVVVGRAAVASCTSRRGGHPWLASRRSWRWTTTRSCPGRSRATCAPATASDYRVVSATSGGEALEVLAELALRDRPVALVASDQRMPEMTGIEVLAEVRRQSPDTKLLLLTAYADTDVAIKAINDIGLDYYLLKPWDPPEERLYPVVDDLLGDWQRRAPRPGTSMVRVVGHRWSDRSRRDQDVPGPQPRALPLARRRARRRGPPAASSSPAPEPSDLPLVLVPDGEPLRAPSDAAAGRGARPAHPRRAAALRPVHRRRRPGRPRRRGVRRVRGAADRGGRARRTRRPGRDERVDRELPRLPQGAVRCRPDPPGGGPGLPVRRRDGARPRRRRASRSAARCEPSCSRAAARSRPGRCSIATGVSYRRLEADGARRPLGSRGVYYGATASEAAQCQGEDVYVVGAANSAGQAVLNLARYAQEGRAAGARRSGSRTPCPSTSSRGSRPPTTSRCGSAPRSWAPAATATSRRSSCATRPAAPSRRCAPAGCSSSSAPSPRTDWLGDAVARDDKGFVVTGHDLLAAGAAGRGRWTRPPFALETSVPGVFAAGDVRLDSMKRVASAVGEGAMAVYLVHRYLATDLMTARRAATSCESLPLLDGPRRRPARASSPRPATRSPSTPGDELFRGGQPAEFWWLLLEGSLELVRHVGHEDTVLGHDGQARAVGRRLPGLGPARRLPGDRAGRRRRAGCCGCRRTRSARWPRRGSRSASTSSRGSSRPCAASSRPPASARRWWRSAPWPPGSPTRSTTRPRRRPAPSTRSQGTADALLSSLRRLAEARHHRGAVRRARRAARESLRPRISRRRARWPWPTARTSSPTGSPSTT